MSQADSWEGATILAEAEDDVVGKTLNGTYVAERILGEGGMGRVYQARHTRIGQKQVAIKVLHPEYIRNAEMLARFQREAETAAAICHPNVVSVYDVDRTLRGLPYIVSEYLDGIDLGQYLKQVQKLSLQTALHIAHQLCEGLAAAHRCGVIHRDLKPSNIFLVGDFTAGVPELPFIKILDFGLSKFMDVSDGQLVTKAGVVMGTPAYMPPEQALGQHTDKRSDVYGAGAILYTCLTGRPPYDESTPQATVLAVIANEPSRPRALEPSIPEHVELVIQRAMSKQPADRYADMDALLQALAPLIEEHRAESGIQSSRLQRAPSFDGQADRAKAVRPKLVLAFALGVTLVFASFALATTGLEQVVGWSLTRREFGLVLACTVGVAFTPIWLLARGIRSRVWDNTGRVLELLSAVRAAAFTVVVAYGLSWFGARILDGVVFRLMGESVLVNLSWPGWDFLLPLMALGMGSVALLREQILSRMLRGWRRAAIVALTLGATLALAAVVFVVGLLWQASLGNRAAARSQPATAVALSTPPRSAAPAKTTSATPTDSSSTAPAASSGASQPEPTRPSSAGSLDLAHITGASQPDATRLANPSPPPAAATGAPEATPPTPPVASIANPPSQPVRLASDDELAAATTRGVEGWSALAGRYPSDARVLRALVLAHASRAAELGDAMKAVRQLFHVAPDEAKRADMQYLVQRAAETPGVPADLAWKILVEDMGIYGPDVLYATMLNKPKLADRAELLLNDATVRQRGSPALGIAYDLRKASSCSARLPLLERAIAIGDERAVAVLGGLSSGSARGCGKNKRKPCPPACPEQAEQFRAAMAKITQRVKADVK